MIKDLNLIGKKYGRLLILSLYRKNVRTKAICLCDCGKTKEVFFYSVKRGNTTSCGCYNKEVITKHGMHGIKEYGSWQHMLRRCDTGGLKSSHCYIEKGINVCERWKDFKNFIDDMGYAPTKNHSIDRIDNNKGYFKENCRWATALEQSRNTNRNRIIYYNGEKKCMSEWAELYNVKYPVLVKRLRMGWDMEKALNTPLLINYQRSKK